MQIPLPGVFPHDSDVGCYVGSTDFKGKVALCGQAGRGHQIFDYVFDSDGLCGGVHPARSDHHGKAFDQRSYDFKRRAAGADHDGCLKFDDRDATGAQDIAGLRAAAHVRRKVRVVCQSTQVNDAPDTGLTRRGREVGSCFAILGFELIPTIHRVDQVKGGVHSAKRGNQRRRFQQVSPHHPGAGSHALAERLRIAAQASDDGAIFFEAPQEASPYVSSCPCQQMHESGPISAK